MKRFEVFAIVNPNAHNPRYGRDMHAPAVSVGVYIARDEYHARDQATDDGLIYNPSVAQYEWVYSHCVQLKDISPLMVSLIEAVKKHAIENYEINGWDIVVECYSDEDIFTVIGNARTISGAIKKLKDDFEPFYIYREEIRAEIF
jgi:hypothetical protein